MSAADFKKQSEKKRNNKINQQFQSMPKKTNRRRQSTMAWQLLLQYFFTTVILIVLLFAVAFLSWFYCQSRVWYGTEPLYPILSWIRERLMLVLGVLSIVIVFGVTFYYLVKPIRYLDDVILASEQLAQLSEEPIRLPRAMLNVEDELNLIREQALRNAMLAKEAEQRKNDLIVYLAHDLKTPLTSVIGYLSLLKDEPQISEPLRDRYTGIALDKAQRLEDLINEFFDITRFNLTTLTLETESINLSLMLEQIVSEFEPYLAEKSLHWHTVIPQGVMISCDPDKLQRVFDNLIRNAANYSYQETEISLRMEQTEQTVQICMRNHGRTIPPEKLAHIFEQFFRVDSSRASATGGSGLGLAIAKEIVKLHGGNICAESRDESITFMVELPLHH